MLAVSELEPGDTGGLWFDELDRTASSPNELIGIGKDHDIDDDAVLSILQFGAMIPPLSPWKGIRRAFPGYRYVGTKMVGSCVLPPVSDILIHGADKQSNEIERVLDCVLKKHIGENEDPVVLFSGGVDSGIIASRLAALGYSNTLLINYAFGEQDLESDLAEKMARRLGLPFARVYGNEHPCVCLDSPGQVYPQPFGDHSTVPTSALARAVVQRLSNESRLIIDGTGADGAFGMLGQIAAWERLVRVPRLARQVASLAYGEVLWKRTGKWEKVGRVCRRSIDMPLLSAVLAQNPLAGTFFNGAANSNLHDLLERWIVGWVGEHRRSQIVGADLALTCANIFAQKAKPILEGAGHKVLYPFLDIEMVSMALGIARSNQMVEAKAPLKRSLARYVPDDMVYRPKSGFVDVKGEVFFSEEFIHHLFAATKSSSPFGHILDRKSVDRVGELLKRKKVLPAQTLNLLWSIVFTDRWYRTVGS